MKIMKIYIVTHRGCEVLNGTIGKLFDSDFSRLDNTEVNVINNHSHFFLEPGYIIHD